MYAAIDIGSNTVLLLVAETGAGSLNGLCVTRKQLGKWTETLCGMSVRRRAGEWPAFLGEGHRSSPLDCLSWMSS